jgi:hypothetical protein
VSVCGDLCFGRDAVPKKTRVDEFNVETVEDALFMLGDAKDWLIRKETAILDLLESVEAGKTTFTAARLAVALDFSEGHKNLNEWEQRLASAAQRAEFPYLNETLKFPHIRLVLPLPPEQPA